MKYSALITYVLFFLTTLSPAAAQSVRVSEGRAMHNDALRPSVAVTAEPQPDQLKDAWQDYMKRNYNVKMKGRRGPLSAERVKIGQISSNTIDLFTLIEEAPQGSQMKVFAAKGYDIYINPDDQPTEYAAMKTIVSNFLKQYLPAYYNDQISATREGMEALMQDKKDYEQNLKKHQEEIDKLKKEMEKARKALDENERALQAKETELEQQERKLQRVREDLRGI